MISKIVPALALVAAISGTGTAWAVSSTDGLIVKGATPGGQNQVYQLGDDSYLGLVGISGGGQTGVTYTTSDLDAFFVDPVLGYYYNTPVAPGAWTGGPSDFDPFGTTFAIDALSTASGKLFDSFWVNWSDDGGVLNILSTGVAGPTDTVGLSNILEGDPLAEDMGVVPLPAPLVLLLGALAGLGLMGRRSKA